jgi:hypothetical protein
MFFSVHDFSQHLYFIADNTVNTIVLVVYDSTKVQGYECPAGFAPRYTV